jgi:hypothetical protein
LAFVYYPNKTKPYTYLESDMSTSALTRVLEGTPTEVALDPSFNGCSILLYSAGASSEGKALNGLASQVTENSYAGTVVFCNKDSGEYIA